VELLSVNCQWSLVIFTEDKENIKHIVDELTSIGYCKAVAVSHHFYRLTYPAWATERRTKKLWFVSYIRGYWRIRYLGGKAVNHLYLASNLRTRGAMSSYYYTLSRCGTLLSTGETLPCINKVIINRV